MPKNQFQRLREANGYSRKEFAEILDCSLSHVCNIERGAARLVERHQDLLIEKFDLDPNYFNSMSESMIDTVTEKDKVVGRNLRFYRKKLNLTQAELAEELGYKQNSSVSTVERGLAPMSKKMMLKAAEFFGVHVSQFFMDKDTSVLKDQDLLMNKFIFLLQAEEKPSTYNAIVELIHSAYAEAKQDNQNKK